LIRAKIHNLKLRFSRDREWYTQKTKIDKKKKIGSYRRLGLNQDAFLYIIDAMYFSGYIDQETIPYYKKDEQNKQSRIELTDKGYNLLMLNINFLSIIDEKKFNDLIIMKDNFEIKVKEKNGWIRTKTISKAIPYELSDHVKRK